MLDTVEDSRPGLKIGFPFVLVILIFVGALTDVLLGGPFLPALAYRAGGAPYLGAILLCAVLLWLAVIRSARSTVVAPTDLAVQTVRSNSDALQPVVAVVLLLVAAAIIYAHTLPRGLHLLSDPQRTTLAFGLATAPIPGKRDCTEVVASNPAYATATFCVPTATLDTAASAGTPLYVTGERSAFGFTPLRFSFTARPTPTPTATIVPPAAPTLTAPLLAPPIPSVAKGKSKGLGK